MTETTPKTTAKLAGRQLLEQCFRAALDAVDPRRRTREGLQAMHLPGPQAVVAVGKAAAAMYRGAEDALGPRIVQGLVVMPEGGGNIAAAPRLTVIRSDHPVPGQRSLAAGKELLRFLEIAPASVVFLISGGSSSLMEVLATGVAIEDLQRANEWLLASGLPIRAVNAVRARLSAIKGGGLLRYLDGRQPHVLVLSDVPGDDPRIVGSGPLIPQKLPALPDDLPDWLEQRVSAWTPPPDSATPPVTIIGSVRQAMEGAAEAAGRLNHEVHLHEEPLQGDAAEAGRKLVDALEQLPTGVHVWGGETTVKLPDSPGYGGRNQTLALSAALVMNNASVMLLAAGTDGRDGVTSHAGAIVDAHTVENARQLELDPETALLRADTGVLFEKTGEALITGPTGTNVMDLVIALKGS
jgi:glycerate 2-kinase